MKKCNLGNSIKNSVEMVRICYDSNTENLFIIGLELSILGNICEPVVKSILLNNKG